jgi:hypothetical protein
MLTNLLLLLLDSTHYDVMYELFAAGHLQGQNHSQHWTHIRQPPNTGDFTQGKQEGLQQISNHRCVQFTSYVSVLVIDTSCYPDLAVFRAWTVAFRFVN